MNFRIPILQSFEWQPPVFSRIVTTPPSSPLKGDRYIVGVGADGFWTGHDEEIATYNGIGWEFMVPNEGTMCWILDERTPYVYSEGIWNLLLSGQTSNITYKNSDYTLQLSDFMVLADASAGAINLTIPSSGNEFEIVKVDTTINSVNLIVSPNLIMDKTSLEIDVPFTALRIRRYGSIWYIT